MVDTIDMIETALTREIERVSAKRERWLEGSMNDVRLALNLNSRIGVMGIEIDEAKEAILADDAGAGGPGALCVAPVRRRLNLTAASCL